MTAVVDLPRPLQPWQTWLGWFDAELAQQIGDMVRRLSDLLGTAPSVSRHGQQEPDGVGDLRSRGSYERLLATEWLLADELPEEFLRRAAASEHLFLAPRLRAARVERSVVAIFDCGPRALGSARLAHIAAWILLARRAGEHGGSLRWGVLQSPDMLMPDDSSEQLATLMRSRSFESATADHVERWRAELRKLDGEASRETWWIGAAGAGLPSALARDDRVLALRATLAAGALEALLAGAGMKREAMLPLPPSDQATALLRGEFRALRSTARPLPANRTLRANRMSLTQGVLMSVPPGHVAIPELGQPAMLVFAVPRRGQAKLAKPRRQQWSGARTPVAATLVRGETQALCASGQGLHFWQMSRFRKERERPPREDFEASASTARLLPMVSMQGANMQRACVLDAAGRLVAWSAPMRGKDAAPAPADVLDRNVRLMVPLGVDRLVYAMIYGDGVWLRELRADQAPSTMQRRLCPAPKQLIDMAATVVGYGSPEAQITSLGFAHKLNSATIWQIFTITQSGRSIDAVDGAQSSEVQIGPGERGIGLTNQRGTKPPALAVLSADRRHLRLATSGSQMLLYESAVPIERCGVCPISGHIAILRRDRQLVVIDPTDLEPLLIVTDNQAAEAREGNHGDD